MALLFHRFAGSFYPLFLTGWVDMKLIICGCLPCFSKSLSMIEANAAGEYCGFEAYQSPCRAHNKKGRDI
jgi:hypothetical protein